MNTKTYLPVFTGFYGTFFESDDDRIIEDLEYQAEELKIKIDNDMFDKFWSSNEASKYYKDYRIEVSKTACDAIETLLKDNGLIEAIEYEDLHSPKEYNFYNDSININLIYSEDNLKAIEKFVTDHFVEWGQYLKDHFTSYDGFISFYDNFPGSEDWRSISDCMEHKTKAGVVLEFICQCLEYDSEKLYYDVSDHMDFITPCLEDFLNELKEDK